MKTVKTKSDLYFEIGILEGKLDQMGVNPYEKDIFKLLEESEAATDLRNKITRINRTLSDIRNAEREANVI